MTHIEALSEIMNDLMTAYSANEDPGIDSTLVRAIDRLDYVIREMQKEAA